VRLWSNSSGVRQGLLAGLFAVIFSSQAAFATPVATDISQESILLSPVSVHYKLKAGDTKTDTINIINDGKKSFDFIVYARPYTVINESYEPNFTSKSQNADAYRWVQFDKPSYHIEPGKTVEVRFTIRVPSNATPGGHYGVLFAETQPNDQVSGNAVKRTKRLGAIMYATVSGNVTTSGTLKGFSVPFFQTKPPLTTSQRVSNEGNTDFAAHTTLKIYDAFGGLKYETQKDYTVLPSTTRKVEIDWANASWLGFYKVSQTTSFLDTNKSSTHYVLLVPVWIYLAAVLIIGARIAYAVTRRRKK
jgi:hypothetical protein